MFEMTVDEVTALRGGSLAVMGRLGPGAGAAIHRLVGRQVGICDDGRVLHMARVANVMQFLGPDQELKVYLLLEGLRESDVPAGAVVTLDPGDLAEAGSLGATWPEAGRSGSPTREHE